MKNRLTTWFRTVIVFLGVAIGVCCLAADAQALQISVTPSSPTVGSPVTFTATGCSGCFSYLWSGAVGGSGTQVVHTFQSADTYTVQVQATQEVCEYYPFYYCWYEYPSAIKQVEVKANEFTVNIIPSAGCTVMAGDGGVDAVETPNGIDCSGTTPANDPLCTEKFSNSAVTALKVVPDAGYAFTGWTVNGAQIKMTSADPLFLTAMPVLAQSGKWITPFTGNTADCQANCSAVTITAPATVKRDEIFDVTLTLDPPPLWEETTVTFDLVGQKTQDLPERGAVQMYDFGYDRNGDGDIEPGQSSYTFKPLLDNGTKTIQAVYNLYQPPQTIKIAASVGGYTFESQPIVVTYQVRQYTTTENNDTVNDYDALITQWVDYWTHWHYPNDVNPYTFGMTDFTDDFIKAICYKESTMLNDNYLANCSPGDENNIMQCKQPCRDGLTTESDVNWNTSPIATDPEKGDLYSYGETLPMMQYENVNINTPAASLKWGIRWLYAKRSTAKYFAQNSIEYAWNLTWHDWKATLKYYRGSSEAVNEGYANLVLDLYTTGKNPHAQGPSYMWPIMTDRLPRQ